MDFYELYTSYTDTQILQILKNRTEYQETAVQAAVRIAIERQLIYSEQDLLSPEFQSVKLKGTRFLPEISSEYQRQKLTGSIFRFLYVLSFLPVAFGFMKYAEGQLNMAYLGIGLGLTWFLLSLLLNKTQKLVLFIPLFILLFSISLAVLVMVFTGASLRYMDIVMLILGTLLPAYMLLLLKKLIQSKPDSE